MQLQPIEKTEKPSHDFVQRDTSRARRCRQLAMAGRFLAHGGCNPSTGMSVVPPGRARRTNTVMLTCGHYDGSGEFAYRVGLPGKSGVGGAYWRSHPARRRSQRGRRGSTPREIRILAESRSRRWQSEWVGRSSALERTRLVA
jgi:hypothetical protein